MKKMFAILLAVALVAALSVTAMAADNAAGSLVGNNSKVVQGIYAAGADVDAYKVAITWGDMQFTYAAAQRVWDTENYEWDTTQAAGWSVVEGKTNTITVVNHSSEDITATFTWTAGANYNGIGANFTDDEGTALAGNALIVGDATGGAAVTEVAKFMPTGTLADSVNALTDLGTITVAIS